MSTHTTTPRSTARGFCVAPGTKHYCDYTCFMPSTKSTSISNNVEFFPDCYKVPATSLTGALAVALQDVKEILENPHPPLPIANLRHRTELNEGVYQLQRLPNLDSVTDDSSCGEKRHSPQMPPVPDPKKRAGHRRSPRIAKNEKQEEAQGAAKVPTSGGRAQLRDPVPFLKPKASTTRTGPRRHNTSLALSSRNILARFSARHNHQLRSCHRLLPRQVRGW